VKDQETVAQFIHLRAQGLSYNRIAAQLNVSKPTLIQWSRKHQFDIQNLRAIETEALAEKCFASRQQRWEQISRDLHRVETELAKRDLAEVPTAQLLSQAARLRAEVSCEVGDIRFSVAARHIPSEEYFEEVLDWQV
jgi:transcriptional regulator with XRE-family HTH domain